VSEACAPEVVVYWVTVWAGMLEEAELDEGAGVSAAGGGLEAGGMEDEEEDDDEDEDDEDDDDEELDELDELDDDWLELDDWLGSDNERPSGVEDAAGLLELAVSTGGRVGLDEGVEEGLLSTPSAPPPPRMRSGIRLWIIRLTLA